MSNIDWGNVLFGFRGRINRAKWWLAVLIYIIVGVVAAIIAAIVGENIGSLVTLAALIPQVWIYLAAGVKRLHDLNRTGAWLVVFLLGPVVLVILFFVIVGMDVLVAIANQDLDAATLARVGITGAIMGLLVFILGIWALIWLGCLRGTVGPNQYGPDPLEGRV
jgi:uncharacterized membrane protein YhaH (DUF805 family)